MTFSAANMILLTRCVMFSTSEAGGRRLEAGGWRLEAGDGRLEARGCPSPIWRKRSEDRCLCFGASVRHIDRFRRGRDGYRRMTRSCPLREFIAFPFRTVCVSASLRDAFLFALCALRSAVCALRSALCALRSALCTLHFALCALRFALCALRSKCKVQSCGIP